MTNTYDFKGWITKEPSATERNLKWGEFQPKKWEESDIDIRITHSAICGSDIHALRSSRGNARYPCILGHEIVGIAVRVGAMAEGGINVGDIVGVGAQADSCCGHGARECMPCRNNEEPYCVNGAIQTYGDLHYNGDATNGGFALYHRARSHFVIKVPDGLAPQFAAPMLCGGITVWSPLKHWGVGPGKRVAVAGIGGLGHLAVLFAKALGAEVVGISRSSSKRNHALALGCDDYIASEEDKDWAINNANRFDLIISAISSTSIPIHDYLSTLALNGTIVQVGSMDESIPVPIFSLLCGRRSLASSAIGSPKEIHEMFEFAATHDIKPWIETRPMADANEAVIDMEAGKACFRYVLVNSS